AILQITDEKHLAKDVVIQAIESALTATYKRNLGPVPEVHVRLNEHTGEFRIFAEKKVVIDVEDPRVELSLKDAQELAARPGIGTIVEVEIERPQDFGRIAAQTARQVIMQRINDAERDKLYGELIGRENDLYSGIVQRIEPSKGVILDLGKVEAVLPPQEQAPGEHYRVGQRLKVYMMDITKTPRGLQVTVSRTHRNLVKRLFELEVPEIYTGLVEIKAIARDPGVRTKVAVAARQDNVDPVGSCVGQRGVRIQNVVNELNGEKIDVAQWHSDPATFVANALRPATVIRVSIDESNKSALVVVPERELSLAIGKDGQNARLAARLTGWRIDIKRPSEQATAEQGTADSAVS
ncbi:MAG: NusA antitermination factor, partial [Chloroflexi bacterium]|nr:NusA antitermination factor [Chloroflexota bacterium]